MSRRSKTKIKKSQPKSRLNFLPESAQAFIARRLVDITAGCFILTGLFTTLALISYNPADPSSNTAGTANQTIQNWMGSMGAKYADLTAQSIGAAGYLFSAVLFIWGIRLLKRQSIRPLFLRLPAAMMTLVFGAIALAQTPSNDWLNHPFLGGASGSIMFSYLQNVLPSIAIIASTAIFTAVTFLMASAFRWNEIKFAAQCLQYAITFTASAAISTCKKFIDWVAHYNDPDYEPQYSMPEFKLPKLTSDNDDNDKAFAQIRHSESKIEPPVTSSEDETTEDNRSFAQKRAVFGDTTPKSGVPVVNKKNPQTSGAKTPTQKRFSLGNDTDWELPPLDALQTPPPHKEGKLDEKALQRNAEMLQNVLADYGVEGEITSINPGPVVTLYELEPAPGVKSSKVISLSDDIARSMSAVSVRCAVVPGRNVIGIELPNKTRQIVYMREILESGEMQKNKAGLPLVLGKDIGGGPVVADLAKMPHLLVAGTTGSGKSVAVNTMIMSILYQLPPEKCRFIMIDPKMLELSVYDDIPHLLTPVVTEPGKAVVALKWAVAEMEERYRAMSKLGVRNIDGYNKRMREAVKNGETIMNKVQTGFDHETGKGIYEEVPMDMTELPYIIIIVDEFADLMLVAGKDVENAIQRLAQMARAAGLHLIMATQRPSVDVITGVIKANFPTRISFAVTSKIDSRTILGEGGAEQLLGMGDMLYMAPGGKITRVHGPFVSDDEVEDVVSFLKSQGEPAYISDVTEDGNYGDSEVMNAMFGEGGSDNPVDELYDQAVMIVARDGKASTSYIQRQLQIGYNRAARIIEEMENQGVISPANSTGKRTVLVQDHSGEAA